MKDSTAFSRLAQKLRIPAGIVLNVFPILCCALLVFRWCGLWLTEPWLVALIIFYYVIAVAYLFFAVITRMCAIEIIGLFLTLATCYYMWVPFNWVLAVLLVLALFIAPHKRGIKTVTTVFATIAGFIVVIIILICILFNFNGLIPDKYLYHTSLDGRYVALEYAFTQIPVGMVVTLYRVNGILLIEEKVLYLANYSHFGGKIEWLDESTINIYGEEMDVFKDPTLNRYIPF